MDSKLTLSIDKDLTKMAKLYAKRHGRSLSDLVENYFKILTSKDDVCFEVSSKLKSMRGILKADVDYNYKKELSDALSKKYLK